MTTEGISASPLLFGAEFRLRDRWCASATYHRGPASRTAHGIPTPGLGRLQQPRSQRWANRRAHCQSPRVPTTPQARNVCKSMGRCHLIARFEMCDSERAPTDVTKPQARMHGQQGSPLERPILLPMSFRTVLRAIKSLPQVHHHYAYHSIHFAPWFAAGPACRHRFWQIHPSSCHYCIFALRLDSGYLPRLHLHGTIPYCGSRTFPIKT